MSARVKAESLRIIWALAALATAIVTVAAPRRW